MIIAITVNWEDVFLSWGVCNFAKTVKKGIRDFRFFPPIFLIQQEGFNNYSWFFPSISYIHENDG